MYLHKERYFFRTAPVAWAVTLLIGGTALTGCGLIAEKAHVSRRFESIHACPAETVTYQGRNNYLAQGCGITSHFTCIDTSHRDDSLLYELMAGSSHNCVHEYSRKTYQPTRIRSKTDLIESHTVDGSILLRVTLMVDGGPLTIIGNPSRFNNQVGFSFSPVVNGDSLQSSNVRFFADGELIKAQKVVVSLDDKRPHIDFIIESRELKRMGQATRLAGDICGQKIVLTTRQKELLAKFDIRFLEERSYSEDALAQ